MEFTNHGCTDVTKPSGHAGHYEPFCHCDYATPRRVNFNLGDVPSTDLEQRLPEDFSGPYKEFNPPGDRTPAVGEKEWGDVPYLPSYLDEAHRQKIPSSGPPDNLYSRGPFFKGVSETHEEFVNRGGIEPRKYHTFVRHYEEPGMKYDKSITQTDFCPPYPMTAKDKNPCLQQPIQRESYSSKSRRAKNPHIKEIECKSVEPKLVYIDEEPKRDFSTETGENYICFQRAKTEKKLMDYRPSPNEIFQDYVRSSHCECPYGIPYHLQNAVIDCSSTPHKDLCTMLECPPERQIMSQDISEYAPDEKNASLSNKISDYPYKCHCK